MQEVSQAYKDSMKSSLRERGYILVSFNIYNQEAQSNATVSQGNYVYFCSPNSIFQNRKKPAQYATLEENFTKVDGSMCFPKRPNTVGDVLENGLVTNSLISDGEFTVTIQSGKEESKGITIDFGENYPIDFDIGSDRGHLLKIRGNDKETFTTDEELYWQNSISVKVYTMKNPHSRLRIQYFLFGHILEYGNESVIKSTHERYVSPIAEDVPQIDFSVELDNTDRHFDVDNPDSDINYFQTNTPVEIYYGYQLPNSGGIEWILGDRLFCSDWEANTKTATIRAVDVLRNLDGEYYKGKVYENGVDFYSLAVDVLQDAGIENYSIDGSLYSIYTTNPIPRVSHKEALQMIANACSCTLSIRRSGAVAIEKKSLYATDVVDFKMEKKDMTSYPKAMKQETVSSVVVSVFLYKEDNDSETLISDTMYGDSGFDQYFYFDDPCYDLSITVDDETTSDLTITQLGCYYAKVTVNKKGHYPIKIIGKKYNVVEVDGFGWRIYENVNGETVEWGNPLISDTTSATNLGSFIGWHYYNDVEYEYTTRGNPELDAGDVIYQENEYHENPTVVVYREALTFDKSFSGKVNTRRVGDWEVG